jgi:alkanesulfonate monooxygenase SsuD/methylene tetrahydromethanopterin reductase-like flavin-dependent oxidoreductase (luciferase family)
MLAVVVQSTRIPERDHEFAERSTTPPRWILRAGSRPRYDVKLTISIQESGIMVEPQLGMSMERLLGIAEEAEELGFGYFFRSDHILPTDARRGIDSPECWTSLGVIAGSTSRIEFGPLVSPIGFRNPALLAKMACTVHSVSHGRLRLGVGAGWYEGEYRAHGYPFPAFHERVAQFAEALEIVSAMVNEGRVEYEGTYFSAHTDCLPRPQGHLRLIVGGRTRPVVRLAARFADEWNTFRSSSSDLSGLRAILDREAGGRDVDVTEMGPYLVAKSQAKLEEYAALQAAALAQPISPRDVIAGMKARGAPCGTVEEFVEQLRSKAALGFKRVYFQTLAPQNTEMMALLADTLKGKL